MKGLKFRGLVGVKFHIPVFAMGGKKLSDMATDLEGIKEAA